MITVANPATALAELKQKLAALVLPAEFASAAAFAKVEIFDLENVAVALEELFMFDDRIAIILIEDADYETSVAGRRVDVKQSLNIDVLFCDRRFSDRQIALMGDATTPGALLLSQLVVQQLTGELPSGFVVLPGGGLLLTLVDAERKNHTGRITWKQTFSICTDWDAAALSRRAISAAAK